MPKQHLTETQKLELHQSLMRWCWAGQEPAEYLDNRGAGFGVLAASHPGAFNLAWVMLGRPDARVYRSWFSGDCPRPGGPLPDISWIVAATSSEFYVQEIVGMRRHFWHVFDRAAQLSYDDFMQEFTPARRRAISRFAGYDIEQYLDHA